MGPVSDGRGDAVPVVPPAIAQHRGDTEQLVVLRHGQPGGPAAHACSDTPAFHSEERGWIYACALAVGIEARESFLGERSLSPRVNKDGIARSVLSDARCKIPCPQPTIRWSLCTDGTQFVDRPRPALRLRHLVSSSLGTSVFPGPGNEGFA